MITFLILALVISLSVGRSPLKCPNATPPPPGSCLYGSEEDLCGVEVCLRGPGHYCDGQYGPCAEGLVCSICNR